MQEIVTVTKIEGEYARVKLDKKLECESCGMCLFPKNASSVELRAKNEVNARSGDKVLIETQKDGKLLSAVLLFLAPLILIGVACLISLLVIKNEIWILFLSLIFLVLWYTILGIIDKKLQKLSSFSPKILKIIEKEEKELGNTGDNGQDRV